jgi:hypothetical protein
MVPSVYAAWRAGRTTYSYSVPSPHRLFKNSSIRPRRAEVARPRAYPSEPKILVPLWGEESIPGTEFGIK